MVVEKLSLKSPVPRITAASLLVERFWVAEEENYPVFLVFHEGVAWKMLVSASNKWVVVVTEGRYQPGVSTQLIPTP